MLSTRNKVRRVTEGRSPASESPQLSCGGRKRAVCLCSRKASECRSCDNRTSRVVWRVKTRPSRRRSLSSTPTTRLSPMGSRRRRGSACRRCVELVLPSRASCERDNTTAARLTAGRHAGHVETGRRAAMAVSPSVAPAKPEASPTRAILTVSWTMGR